MRLWLMRSIGLLNLIFSALGIYYFAGMTLERWQYIQSGFSSQEWTLYGVTLVLSVSFLIAETYLGFLLIRGVEKAVLPSVVVFSGLLVYSMLEATPFLIPLRLTGAEFLGTGPLHPQKAFFYPLIGLIAALLLRPRKIHLNRTPNLDAKN